MILPFTWLLVVRRLKLYLNWVGNPKLQERWFVEGKLYLYYINNFNFLILAIASVLWNYFTSTLAIVWVNSCRTIRDNHLFLLGLLSVLVSIATLATGLVDRWLTPESPYILLLGVFSSFSLVSAINCINFMYTYSFKFFLLPDSFDDVHLRWKKNAWFWFVQGL